MKPAPQSDSEQLITWPPKVGHVPCTHPLMIAPPTLRQSVVGVMSQSFISLFETLIKYLFLKRKKGKLL